MSTITQVERSMLWQKARPERQAAFNKKAKRKLRQEVLDAYGGKCACCGEEQYEFLCIDHVNDDGNERHNCNMAKGFHGQCPHSTE